MYLFPIKNQPCLTACQGKLYLSGNSGLMVIWYNFILKFDKVWASTVTLNTSISLNSLQWVCMEINSIEIKKGWVPHFELAITNTFRWS